MASNALLSQKDVSFCDVHRLNASERESMERATVEMHAAFEALLAGKSPKFSFRKRLALQET